MTDLCLCGSGQTYAQCCAPFHNNTAFPDTAEQLMRSRYCAFALRLPGYLLATLHPSKRAPDELTQLEQAVKQSHWLGLEVVSTQQGQAGDSSGRVAFRAHYDNHGHRDTLEENSRFVRENQRWFYLDGEFAPTRLPGRNDPCWCGSGQKFKKCHG